MAVHSAKLKASKHSDKDPVKDEERSHLLFLGLPVTPLIAVNLTQAHQPTLALFISEEKGLYLEKRLHQGMFYLGKTLDPLCSIETLRAVERNLHSLLCRVLDESHVKREEFVLFALS